MLLLESIRSIMRGCIANSIFRKPTRPSLPLRKAPHLSPSLSSLRKRGCNRPTVLNFLPLRLSCKESSTFSPSPSSMVFTPPSVPPFPVDRNLRKRGCNRPPVLGTATLSGWRGIKARRHLVRDGTALLHLASGLRHLVRAGTAGGGKFIIYNL